MSLARISKPLDADVLKENEQQQEQQLCSADDEPNSGRELDDESVVRNLSSLGRTADGTKLAYLSLSLAGAKLSSIALLARYKELQTLQLSHNRLTDLSPLSELPFLLSLDVSHNEIEKLFDFLPPYNLKEANFAFNRISEIGSLSNFHYLQTLLLNNNRIGKIEGLEYCQRLKVLNLAHNSIRKIEDLDNLPLVDLDLRSNQIKRIEGLQTLRFLRTLNLSCNSIKSLHGLPEKHEFLENLDLENNKIASLDEIEHLVGLSLLRDLNLHHNPIRELEDYRLLVIFKMTKLNSLDRRKVDPIEKVNARNQYHPSAEYIASRDHITNFIFNIIQDHKVRESTLPSIDSPYPVLILCGPEGCGSADLARKLAEEYPGYFDYVVPHTTRKRKPTEIDKVHYNFLKMQEFEQDVTQGKFICCNEYYGDWYGLQWDSIESIAKQGLACVTQMELEALMSFKQTYFEPRCVLVLTLDRTVHAQRLRKQGCTSDECDTASSRIEWYAEYNRDHPGFFDAVIVTDNIADGYVNLCRIVMNYLGIASPDQQNQMKLTQASQSMQLQRQLTHVKSPDEIKKPGGDTVMDELNGTDLRELKELELPRSDSFLPSNTATGNRSQLSHMSIESLSQVYNQSLRLKFGSAPAQLLTKGEHAEKSLEKRMSAIRRQFDLNNIVNTKSQVSQHLSKQAMQGTASTNSWSKWNSSGEAVRNKKATANKVNNSSNDSISNNKSDSIIKNANNTTHDFVSVVGDKLRAHERAANERIDNEAVSRNGSIRKIDDDDDDDDDDDNDVMHYSSIKGGKLDRLSPASRESSSSSLTS